MKILIIGGTEFFGKLLVARLLEAGHELTLFTRGNKKPISFWSKVNHIKADRTNYADFKAKLAGYAFDVVIDNVIFSQADMESVIDVFASRPKPPHYIFCSSVAVYPDWSQSKEEILEEIATLEPTVGDDWDTAYANGKRAAEKYLIKHHGIMPYTIIRPTVIEGVEDPIKRTWFWIQRIKDGAPIIVSTKNRDTLYRHVSSIDVAQAFFLAVGNKRAYNQIFNVAGEEILTIKEYIEYIAKALGKTECTLCWVTEEDLKTALPEYMLPPFFNCVRLISNIDKIKRDLGYKPQKTSVWIEETVKAFLNELSSSFGYEHRKDELRMSDTLGDLEVIKL